MILLSFLLVVQSSFAQASPSGPDSSKPSSPSAYALANGMGVILLPQPESDKVFVGIIFRGGADAQTNKTAGLFRMLENVLFRGTASSPGEPEPAGALEALGASDLSGGAQADRFSFSFAVDPDQVAQGLDTIAYLFSGLRLETAFSDPATFEEARNAGLIGINQELSDPSIIFEAAVAKKMFVAAPWRLDVLGADYIVKAASEASVEALVSTWLVPNNAALIIAGRFTPESVAPMIEKAFSSWKKAADPLKKPPAAFPKPGITRPTLMVYPDPSVNPGEATIEMRYRGPDTTSGRYGPALLWAEMASREDGRLAQAVAKGMPKWSSPSNLTVSYRPSRSASWFSVSVRIALDPKANIADSALSFKEIVRGTEMYAMKTNSGYFSPKEYERARTSLLEKRMAQLSDPLDAGNLLADAWVQGGFAWLTGWTDKIEKVTSKDIVAFADEYFMKNLEIVSMRMNPNDYASRKKSFDAYGFELITPQKAFWWQ